MATCITLNPNQAAQEIVEMSEQEVKEMREAKQPVGPPLWELYRAYYTFKTYPYTEVAKVIKRFISFAPCPYVTKETASQIVEQVETGHWGMFSQVFRTAEPNASYTLNQLRPVRDDNLPVVAFKWYVTKQPYMFHDTHKNLLYHHLLNLPKKSQESIYLPFPAGFLLQDEPKFTERVVQLKGESFDMDTVFRVELKQYPCRLYKNHVAPVITFLLQDLMKSISLKVSKAARNMIASFDPSFKVSVMEDDISSCIWYRCYDRNGKENNSDKDIVYTRMNVELFPRLALQIVPNDGKTIIWITVRWEAQEQPAKWADKRGVYSRTELTIADYEEWVTDIIVVKANEKSLKAEYESKVLQIVTDTPVMSDD